MKSVPTEAQVTSEASKRGTSLPLACMWIGKVFLGNCRGQRSSRSQLGRQEVEAWGLEVRGEERGSRQKSRPCLRPRARNLTMSFTSNWRWSSWIPLGWITSPHPPNWCLSGTQNVSWAEGLCRHNYLRIQKRSYGIRVDPKSIESVLIRDRNEHTETQRRRRREDECRGWSDASTSQEMPGSPCND